MNWINRLCHHLANYSHAMFKKEIVDHETGTDRVEFRINLWFLLRWYGTNIYPGLLHFPRDSTTSRVAAALQAAKRE